MANLTLTKEQSALINSGRQQIIGPGGDLWRMMPGRVDDDERFTIASEYNDLEDEIDLVIDGGGLVFETYGDNTLHGIGKAPNRPKPPTS